MVAVVGIAAAGNIHLDQEVEVISHLPRVGNRAGPVFQPDANLRAAGVRRLALRRSRRLRNRVREMRGRALEVFAAGFERSAIDYGFTPILTQNAIGVTGPV